MIAVLPSSEKLEARCVLEDFRNMPPQETLYPSQYIRPRHLVMGDEPAFIDIEFMKDFNQRRERLSNGIDQTWVHPR